MKCFEQHQQYKDNILDSIKNLDNSKFTIGNNLENMTTEQLKKIAKNLQKITGMLV